MLAAVSESFESSSSGINARISNLRQNPVTEPTDGPDDGFDTVSTISKTFALPFTEFNVIVNSTVWNVFDAQGNFLFTEQTRSEDAIAIAKQFRFREMQGVTVSIRAQIQDSEHIRTLSSVDFDLQGSGTIVLPTSVSPAFIDAYKVLADNYSTSYLRDLPVARPKMLIISHPNLANYQTEFVKWKRSIGFDVMVVNRADIGNTVDAIKQYLITHYQTHHYDYLLLLGDVNGNYSIPTAFYPSPEYAENDADDHQYTLLEGNDYFPEMLVGRFSFNDISEFLTIASKTISYERNPFMADTNWMKRGLVVAGNYAEGGLRPTTPVHMSRWLRNKMLNYGYAQVDSVFYPPTYPGTTSIQTAINQGVQLISYRGWGDVSGWHYPSFHIPDLNSTVNGPRMPIVFSIVCNTGDFANVVNPSFGEKWMRMGSTAQPNGCVAFVGPSDLHTKTRLNNSISSGAFRSILDWGVRGFGSSVLLGKLELYKNFPNDIADNQYVPFYYHVYNLLSDPSMNMWSLVPQTIPESVIEGGLTFAQSDSHIRINAANLEGAIVSGSKNGTDFTYAKVMNGFAILPLLPEDSGDLTLTISKPNFVPLVRTLTPTQPAGIGIELNNVYGATLSPNQTYQASTVLKNYGSTSQSITSLTITAEPHASVSYNHIAFTLPPGGSHTINYQITGSSQIVPREAITVTISIPGQAVNEAFQMWGGGAEFTILSATGTFPIGQSSSVSFNIVNSGITPMAHASVQIISLTEAASFPAAPINLGSISPGETKNLASTITVQSGAWNGRNLPLKMIVSEDGYQSEVFYALTAGTASNTSPTGPDAYGYFAYDSNDVGFPQTPVYNWVEIDPEAGGQGSVFPVVDDGSRTVDLPFTFRFYGRDYDQITMCSNGWLSFGETDMFDFYNHYIPAALGPYAMVAGYWDDLKGMKTGADSTGASIFTNMRVCYWHDAPNNRYIVEWAAAYNQYNIELGPNASLEKFQIILIPQPGNDGDIIVQYHTVDNPGTTTNYCTVGIEDHNQLVGLTYTHGNVYPLTASTLAPGLAIRFTTSAPDSYVSNDDPAVTPVMALEQNYPNPFNPITTIRFSTSTPGKAALSIYNMKGQIIRKLANTNVAAGQHSVVWDGTDDNGSPVGSGLYMYRLDINGQSSTRKMLLMK
jgi:hypothetical protein